MNGQTVHTAPVVVPIGCPPIADGAVVVMDGLIRAVGAAADIMRTHRKAQIVEWSGVLLPGLVNAHTHLQYTGFSEVGALRHASYPAWSDRFIAEYSTHDAEDWGAIARTGVGLALATGTTAFADVVTDVDALDALVASGVAGVSYLEVIGVDAARWESEVAGVVEQVVTSAPTSDAATVGISPHAPYSLDEPVLPASAGLARRLGVRLHVHLAESDGEDDYYRTGSGHLADRVAMRVGHRWGVLGRGGAGMGAGEFARDRGLLGPDSHVAHGVYLGAQGRAIVRDAGSVVALCPRSNLTVGIDPPPVASFLAERVPIAVGTDSLASNTSLDLMADVAMLRTLAVAQGYAHTDLDHRLLGAATAGGAAALGMSDLIGSLIPGHRADFAVFDVDPNPDRVERSLVEHGAGRCIATVTAGELRR